MKISGIIFSAVLALTLAIGFSAAPTSTAQAAEFKGKIEKVIKEGRGLMIGGKTYAVSGSRSNICIKGACDQDRGMLKAGMNCKGSTSSKKNGTEIKKVSCK
jgi:hypothetical protein